MNLLTQRSRWSALALVLTALSAQTAAFRGRVTDQGGALVSASEIAVIGSNGGARNTETGGSGIDSFNNAPGKYTAQAFYLSGNFSGAVTRRGTKNQHRTWKIQQLQRISPNT